MKVLAVLSFYIICGLFFSKVLYADILFIDLNHVDLEIKVAREAAAKRGEKLIVIPNNRNELIKSVALENELKRLSKLLEDARCGEKVTASCERLSQQMQAAAEASKKNLVKYSLANLEKDLSALPSGVTSVMISGHDGGGNFSGEFGRIKADEFLNAFEGYKGRDEIRSLYLLGCNSATTYTFGETWKTAFPKASLIVGYEGYGYLKNNPASHNFIKSVIAEEPKLLATQSMDEAQAKIKKFFKGDKTHGIAACLQKSEDKAVAVYLSSTKNASKLSDVLKCGSASLQESTKVLKCVKSKGPNCSLKQIAELKIGEYRAECAYLLPPNYTKGAGQIYLLQSFTNPGSALNYKTLFAKLPSRLIQQYRLDDDLTSFSELEGKFAALKKDFEMKSTFDQLKTMSSDELRRFTQQKIFFDQAWLGVSNLSLDGASKLLKANPYKKEPVDKEPMISKSDTISAALLRAEAFSLQFPYNVSPKDKFRQRILELESDKLKSPKNAEINKAEISALKEYEKKYR